MGLLGFPYDAAIPGGWVAFVAFLAPFFFSPSPGKQEISPESCLLMQLLNHAEPVTSSLLNKNVRKFGI